MIRTMSNKNYIDSNYKCEAVVIPNFKNEEADNIIDSLGYNSIGEARNTGINDIICYVDKYYTEVLSKTDPSALASELRLKILTSDDGILPLRHLVGAYLHLTLDEEIKELEVVNDNLVREDIPKYIFELVEQTIKNHTDMKGFQSIYALNLFNEAKMYEEYLNQSDMNEDVNYIKSLKAEVEYLKKMSLSENEKRIDKIQNQDNTYVKKMIVK